MSAAEKVAKRLKPLGIDLLPGTEVHSTRAGYWGRKTGAWSWSTWHPNMSQCIGSQIAVGRLMKCANWEIDRSTYDWSVDPCLRCTREGLGACNPRAKTEPEEP